METEVGERHLLLRFSNSRRLAIENQNSNENIVLRSITPTEHYFYNFLPAFLTSTLLAPLNRFKLLAQVHPISTYNQEKLFNVIKGNIFQI